MVYFEIFEGELYSSWTPEGKPMLYFDRYYKVAGVIHTLLINKENGIPDTSFLVNLGDGITQNDGRSPYGIAEDRDYTATVKGTLPVFVFSRDRFMRNAKHFPLFPDDYSIGSGDPEDFYRGGLDAGMKIIKYTDRKPYEYKRKPIMWRGKNTSPHCYCDLRDHNIKPGCYTSPKMMAVNLSASSHYLDVKFAAVAEHLISDCDRMWGTTTENMMSKQERSDFQKLLVIDGYKSTYPGFAHSLFHNAVTLKVEGSNTAAFPQNVWEQWFHSQLVPYYHYYPIDAMGMNESLRNAYEFLEKHVEVAKEISERSSAFAEEHLTTCAMEKYIVLVLRGYEARVQLGSRRPLSQKISDEVKAAALERYARHIQNGLMKNTLSRIDPTEPGVTYHQPMPDLMEPLQPPRSDGNITELREILLSQQALLESLLTAAATSGVSGRAGFLTYAEVLMCGLVLNIIFHIASSRIRRAGSEKRKSMFS
eukprot:TRINITY_DN42188_c0_g1_i1.p1 TRINITY_DN42188_c0_g1~~TRINITY_DN42188_c0_g1_i1.p1  ORF type:complete len:551 (+),score=102.27 TRINITY_DN42188_c0_g1_i1:220-1653(+)